MSGSGFARRTVIATLVIGVISGFIPALQGTLLPQLVFEGRLGLAELGRVAMAEAIGTLGAVTVANAWLKPQRLRLYVVAAAIVGLLLDLATARLSGGQILAVRFLHGVCAGVLLWVWVGLLTRIDNPARWIAIYVTSQAALLMLLSSFFSATLLPWGGAMAGFAAVALLYGLMALLAFLVPPRFDPLTEDGGSIIPPIRGWIGLFAVFCQLAAILSMWVYAKAYAAQIGLDDVVAGFAISLALASQILAGLCATAIAGRIGAGALLVFISLASIGALAALLAVPTVAIFTVATIVFAFFWMLAPPFHMPYLLGLDPTRRAAVHMATAQLLGVAVGPAVASLAVGEGEVGGAFLVAAAFYAVAAVIVALTALRPSAQPA